MLRARKKRELKKPRPIREIVSSQEEGVITGHFEQDYAKMQDLLANSSDLLTNVIRTQDDRRIALFFYQDLTNQQVLSQNIIRPIQAHTGPLSTKILTERLINVPSSVVEKSLVKIGPVLATGAVALIIEGVAEAVLVTLQQFTDRGIERSQSEDVITGPHRSFSEELGNNLALLRRSLSSPRLKIQTVKLGRISQTTVAIVYIEGVCQENLVDEAEERLNRIDIDIVSGATFLIEFLQDKHFSILPQFKLTERPDRVIASLSEGRIAIIGDGDPTCLIAPFFLPEALQSSEDYYEKPLVATFLRWLRLLSMGLAIFLPGLWIALVSFHHGAIPPKLFNSIVAGSENVPLPTILEAFLLLLAFDIVIEASTRLPSAVGQAIGIVGAIILGQSAVQASLISPSMTIVVALAGLAVYTQPSPDMIGPLRLLKYFVLAASSILGVFGTIWALILLTIMATSMRSFGYPAMFPVAPFNTRGMLDILVKLPNTMLCKRPHFLAAENEQRLHLALPQKGDKPHATKDADS